MTAIPATVARCLVWQYYDGAAWQTWGQPFDLGSLVRTRRAAEGPRQTRAAARWRLVKLAGFDWDTNVFAANAVRFWQELGELSEVRIRPFGFDDDLQRYFLVHTDRNLEVYHQDIRLASIPANHVSEQVPFVRYTQVLDTMLLFHVEHAPERVTRQGAHDQWDLRLVDFASLPIFDFDGTNAGGVNDVQQLEFVSYVTGDTFNITLETEVTGSIAFSSVGADCAAAIQTALEALANVGAGGVTVTSMGGDVFLVEFLGPNAGMDVGEMGPKTLVSAAGLVRAATITQGQAGGEPMISVARGWPACGTFYQQRLWLGGLKSRPQTVIASRIGDFFEFASKGTATAIDVTVDTDETTKIDAIFPGQNLQLLTSSAEFWFPQEPIVPPPPVKRATKRGIAKGIPAAEISGATMFVTTGGKAVAEFLYDNIRSNYQATFLSKFATHLFAGGPGEAARKVVDMGFRRALTPHDCDRAIFPRDDGLAVVMEALREDDVTGFVRWTTPGGAFLAAAADSGRDEYVAVRRRVGVQDRVLLEKVDATAFLDCQVRSETSAPAAVLGGLDHLEGQTVGLMIDGTYAGEAVVAAGAVTLPEPALREVCAGVRFTPRGRTLEAVQEADPRGGGEQKPAVAAFSFDLGPTSDLSAGLAGGRMYPVPLKRGRDVVEGEGETVAPFTGWTTLAPVPGFRLAAQCEFEQTRPGPLEIRQIVLAVEN